MKVKCIDTEDFNLLELGKMYNVYSIFLTQQNLKYLIAEEGIVPFPFLSDAVQFEIVDSLLPLEWHFIFRGYKKEYDDPNPLIAVWGYKEMALDPKHYIDLLEREPEALEIFYKRKKEIDEYEELRAQK